MLRLGYLRYARVKRQLGSISLSCYLSSSGSPQTYKNNPTKLKSTPRRHDITTNHMVSRFRLKNRMLEVPVVVGGEEIFTNDRQNVSHPQEHSANLANVYYANRCQIENAIKAALQAQGTWGLVSAEQRIDIWRNAANMIEEDSAYLTALIILGLGKTITDANNDVQRLLISLRSSADYLENLSKLRFDIEGESNVFSTFKLRPMEGFVAAMAPFESAALSATLALFPIQMGNTLLWRPTLEVAPASYLIFQTFLRAGLPPGVINFVPANERLFLDCITQATHFAGLNYHGETENVRYIFKQVSNRMQRYICFPRLVAECPGKNFHFVHHSANMQNVCEATMDAAFTFAGQYSNSLSRLYAPSSKWPELKQLLEKAVQELKVGDPSLVENGMGPVINKNAFLRHKALIDHVRNANKENILCGGVCDNTVGYFVQPTIIMVSDPLDPLLSDPVGGPILPVFVYADDALTDALKLAAQSKYALSGSVFAEKDEIITYCLNHLRMSASNLYVNERCTGNSQGLTPFGGNRLSGTNDKCGTANFLMRWSSPQLVEETISTLI